MYKFSYGSPQASDEYNENVLTQAAKRHPEILMSNVSPFGEPLPIKISGISARPEAMNDQRIFMKSLGAPLRR